MPLLLLDLRRGPGRWVPTAAGVVSRPNGYLLANQCTTDDVLREVARGFEVSVDDIVGPSRERVVVMARFCAMAVIHESTDLSYPMIGRLFDRHHTTVMHAVKKVLDDPTLAESVRQVVEELRPPPTLFAVEDAP